MAPRSSDAGGLQPTPSFPCWRSSWFPPPCAPAGCFAVLLLARGNGTLGTWGTKSDFAVLMALELLQFGSRLFQAQNLPDQDRALESIPAAPGGPFRVASRGPSGLGDIRLCRRWGKDHVGGYEPMMIARHSDLIKSVHQLPAHGILEQILPGADHRVLALLAAHYWIISGPATPSRRSTPPGMLGPVRLFESAEALPRVLFAKHVIVSASEEERLHPMSNASFNPHTVVLNLPSSRLRPGREYAGSSGRNQDDTRAASTLPRMEYLSSRRLTFPGGPSALMTAWFLCFWLIMCSRPSGWVPDGKGSASFIVRGSSAWASVSRGLGRPWWRLFGGSSVAAGLKGDIIRQCRLRDTSPSSGSSSSSCPRNLGGATLVEHHRSGL
jgi:hypothetical protein